MTIAQKLVTGVIGIGLVTTLILPGRQTPRVLGAITGLIRGSLATAMGTGKKV